MAVPTRLSCDCATPSTTLALGPKVLWTCPRSRVQFGAIRCARPGTHSPLALSQTRGMGCRGVRSWDGGVPPPVGRVCMSAPLSVLPHWFGGFSGEGAVNPEPYKSRFLGRVDYF